MRNFSFNQRLLSGIVITLIAASIMAVISYNSISSLQHNSERADSIQQMISTSDKVLGTLTDARSNSITYLITGSKDNLEAYHYAASALVPSVQQLRQSAGNDPLISGSIDSLNYYVSAELLALQKVTESHAGAGTGAVMDLMADAESGAFMAKAQKSVSEIQNAGKKALYEIHLNRSVDSGRTMTVIMIGSAIVFAFILILFSFIIRTFRKQKSSEENLRISNLELEKISKENAQQNWILEGAVVVDVAMRGAQALDVRCLSFITEVCKYVRADLGAIYIADPTGELLHIEASYAFPKEASKEELKSEVGLIGQAVVQKKGLIFRNVPKNYIKVSSGFGSSLPETIFIQPVFVQEQLVGVVELAFSGEITLDTDRLFEKVAYSVGVSIQAAQGRISMQRLFERTQQQAEELESQQEELRTTNEELVHKTHALQASEEELRVQQEELRQINSELEEKAELLEDQNKAVHDAREAISLKVEELERTSKYKSEFLANMSHELRTPLNSILILARILKENKNANLSDDQIKYAGVIHNAGSDLLTLINDILDLAKIESGKIDLTIEDVRISEISHDLELLFNEIAKNKKIKYIFNVSDNVPESLRSDRLRLEQILKNLLSNAFKFTPEKGSISVGLTMVEADHKFSGESLQSLKDVPVLAFTVKDTGIGIDANKQKVIFEAFQQADGSTSRKYGGTGLGLSISREIANILGGEIGVESQPGQGSSFTLYLPVSFTQNKQTDAEPGERVPFPAPAVSSSAAAVMDAVKLPAGKENTILIVEDDVNFAEVLKDYATERGFKPLLAYQGDHGLEMARQYLPNAIILDIMLPVMDGWSILKQLKDDPKTKDIPVHLMSAGDERPVKARKEGAIGFMKKPVDKERLDEAFNLLIKTGQYKLNKVLIIEDHEIQSENLRNQLLKNDVIVKQAFDGAEALDILQKEHDFDCIILDLTLPDMSGLDLLDRIKAQEKLAEIPVVINTAMELDQDGMARIMKHTHAMVLKNKQSNDRLMDEVNLFMNKIKKDGERAPAYQKADQTIKSVATPEKALKGKSVLIVDDDMRNIFALTSALEAYDLKIEIAVNGLEALKKLDEKPDLDVVLMDIMMPEMDGYEAMREIRKQNRFSRLPIIALTAKAMKNDREKCIEAGANDYISKPVDIDKLLSLIRVWLS